MKLIKDLGMLPISENSKHKARFCIYECSNPECATHFKANASKVKSRSVEFCPKCAKDGRHRVRHGDTGTKLHTTWLNMKARCTNPNSTSYKHYGKLGVVVCDAWLHSYETFRDWALANGYSDTLSIDRIDPTANYDPDNCRWVDQTTQCSNIRATVKANGLCTGIHPSKGKYKAMLSYREEVKYLGLYDTLEEAVTARNNYIIDNNLPHTVVNLAVLKEQYATQKTIL